MESKKNKTLKELAEEQISKSGEGLYDSLKKTKSAGFIDMVSISVKYLPRVAKLGATVAIIAILLGVYKFIEIIILLIGLML